MAYYGSGQTLKDHNFTSRYATELVELSFFRSWCEHFKYFITSKHLMSDKRAHWWWRATYTIANIFVQTKVVVTLCQRFVGCGLDPTLRPILNKVWMRNNFVSTVGWWCRPRTPMWGSLGRITWYQFTTKFRPRKNVLFAFLWKKSRRSVSLPLNACLFQVSIQLW